MQSPKRQDHGPRAWKNALKPSRLHVPSMQTEMLELADFKFNGCVACGQCMKEFTCSQADDFSKIITSLDDPALVGIIVATPVYFGTMTSQCKAFLDRCVIFRRNGFRFHNKVGGVIAVGGVRNGGQELTIQAVHAAMLVWDMVVVSDGRPTSHFGGTVWSSHPDGVSGGHFRASDRP